MTDDGGQSGVGEENTPAKVSASVVICVVKESGSVKLWWSRPLMRHVEEE